LKLPSHEGVNLKRSRSNRDPGGGGDDALSLRFCGWEIGPETFMCDTILCYLRAWHFLHNAAAAKEQHAATQHFELSMIAAQAQNKALDDRGANAGRAPLTSMHRPRRLEQDAN
jgi:hypothetical protein